MNEQINDEREIVKRAQEGDSKAFETLYLYYYGCVFAISIEILKNHHDAEELTQDVWIKVFKNIQDFKLSSRFATWAVSIARNTSIDFLRRRKRVSYFSDFSENDPMDFLSLNMASHTPLCEIRETIEERMEIMCRLHSFVESTFPEQWKEILRLRYQGKKQYEIAQEIGYSQSGVSKTLRKMEEVVDRYSSTLTK